MTSSASIASPIDMATSRSAIALLAALLIVGPASCGDDNAAVVNDPSTTTTTTDVVRLAPADYRAAISAICVEGDADAEAAAQAALAAGEPTADTARTVLVDRVIPIVEREIADAGAARGPVDLEAEVRNMLTTARAELDRLREVAEGNDPLSAFAGDPFPATHAMAAALGIDGCTYHAEG